MDATCHDCQKPFTVSQDDAALMKKASPTINKIVFEVPNPTHCPPCRQKRRFAIRNERHLHWRTCDKTGEKILSLYAADSPHTIYKESVWYGDDWDPLEYEREFDFSRPFFEQFRELQLAVPRRAMNQDGTNENCEFTTMGMNNKSCYMAFGCLMCEDVLHSTWTLASKDTVDCYLSNRGELLYECTDCTQCYQCYYSHSCVNCNNVHLSEDCHNCTNCIGCKNLRHKEFHIYNKPVSKQEFNEKLHELQASGWLAEKEVFDAWKLQFPHCYASKTNCENSTGDFLDQAKNCHECFDVVQGAEDSRYCQLIGIQCRDVMDCTSLGVGSELLYECSNSISCNSSAFIMWCKESRNCFYCDHCRPATNCFGCVGLKHKEFCILNKQYSEAEYYELVPKIIDHMKQTGEWGEFFPISIASFPYNESLAHDLYPLTETDAKSNKYPWSTTKRKDPESTKVISASDLPLRISDIPDDILNWAIRCEKTGKIYKIIKQELTFYRGQGLPIPRLHPEERQARRRALRNPNTLWERQCAQCSATLKTTYEPSRPEIIFCEDCYIQTVTNM